MTVFVELTLAGNYHGFGPGDWIMMQSTGSYGLHQIIGFHGRSVFYLRREDALDRAIAFVRRFF